MMDHFGRLADELIDRLEWIEDDPTLQGDGALVMRHLQRAINAACEADKVRRQRREAAGASPALGYLALIGKVLASEPIAMVPTLAPGVDETPIAAKAA